MLVEIRPIELDSKAWAPSQDKSFKRPVYVQAAIKNGQYQVDITPARLKELEGITGYDLSLNTSNVGPHPFWDDVVARVKLENHTELFDTADPLVEIKMGILRAHPTVANSVEEYHEDKWPDAEFVIFDRQADTEIKSRKASKVFESGERVRNMTPDMKKSIILIMTGEDVSGQTDKYLDGTLLGIIEKDLDKFLKFAEMEIEDLADQAMIVKALDHDILTESDSRVFFNDVELGFGQSGALEFLRDSKNYKLRDSIKSLVDQLK